MLIAIMSDTFARVTEISEQSMLKEICSIMADNEFVLNRQEEFKNSKYLIIAKVEKAGGFVEKQSAGGNPKQSMQAMIEEVKRNNKAIVDELKGELLISNQVL